MKLKANTLVLSDEMIINIYELEERGFPRA